MDSITRKPYSNWSHYYKRNLFLLVCPGQNRVSKTNGQNGGKGMHLPASELIETLSQV